MEVTECQNEKCIHYCVCKAHCVDERICSWIPCYYFETNYSNKQDIINWIYWLISSLKTNREDYFGKDIKGWNDCKEYLLAQINKKLKQAGIKVE